MPEPHAGTELEQAGLCCWRGSLSPDSELFGRSPHQQRFADGIGRRELHKAPGLGREIVEPPPEALLDPPGERHRAGQCEPEPARQFSRRQPPRQLQQCQRVTAGLTDDLVPDPGVQAQ
jgi:hypothetical protein